MTASILLVWCFTRRCFATARELGLEQGEQHRLLRLAAAHAAETELRDRSQSAAVAGASARAAAPAHAGAAEAVSPEAPQLAEEDQQPAAVQGEPVPEPTMSGRTSASADDRAAAEGDGAGLLGEVPLTDDGPVRATAATLAADRPQLQTPSTEQLDWADTSVASAARTEARDRQVDFVRGVCRRLQTKLPVSFSRYCAVAKSLIWQVFMRVVSGE